MADCLALGYVRPQRLPRRGADAAGEQDLRRPAAAVVSPSGKGKPSRLASNSSSVIKTLVNSQYSTQTEPFDDPVAYKGEVIVGLKFVPPDPARQDRERDSCEQRANKAKKSWSRGSLHVLVKEARNLQTRAKNSGTCDPFCKRFLLFLCSGRLY